ncbi:site-specific integrase [Acidobacteria bacterium AB60]|nr:site-specific integrase [Acidobacteria bacterium AB60]
MPKRTRYQQGSVQRDKRRNGPDVWIFRWRELGPNGKSIQRNTVIGSVADLPNRASALKAAEALRIDANQQTPRTDGRPSTVAELIEHYRLKELTENDQGRKAHSTRAGYQCYLNGWILPRWGNHRLQQVKSVAVEEWLGSIKRARGTKAKIRNIMSALFSHAMRYEWTDKNPIKLVRQSAKRERIPDVLELHELQALLERLAVRERTLVLLDAATGLRVSELLALRWDDIDFESLEIRVTESIWHQVLGVCKTEASAKPVPMDSYMAEDLLRWRKACAYPMEGDWVFASPRMKGKQPYWPDNLMKRYIKPAAKKVGIHKNIGWHTFRHSFGTILKANGEDVKTVQELLRHANSRITLDVYTQAVTSHKRAAQSKVVQMIVPNAGTTKVQAQTGTEA